MTMQSCLALTYNSLIDPPISYFDKLQPHMLYNLVHEKDPSYYFKTRLCFPTPSKVSKSAKHGGGSTAVNLCSVIGVQESSY